MVPGALFRQGYSSADHVIKTFKVFKQKKGLTHAVVMLFCLSILLSLVYTQTRSHVYVEPQQAIKAAIGFDEASEISSVDDSKFIVIINVFYGENTSATMQCFLQSIYFVICLIIVVFNI